MNERKLVLRSRCVLAGRGLAPVDGFVAVRGNLIEAVGPASAAAPFIAAADETRDLGAGTLMPGLIDVHTFFAGWVMRRIGADCSAAVDAQGVAEALRAWKGDHPSSPSAIGRGLPERLLAGEGAAALAAALDARLPDAPAVAFTSDAGACALSAAARARYGFTPDSCYAERVWRLLAECLAMPEARAAYTDYQAMLSSRGVTAIKEMSFDDYGGFADEMERRERGGDLTVRVSMMSQPVGRGADLVYARDARRRFRGPFVRFSGFNRMTDRGVRAGLAEMIDPYEAGAAPGVAGRRARVEPEWETIERELRAVDAEGFRFSLHCQGDGAVRRAVSLFAALPRDGRGRLRRRHAITDLENADISDLVRFGGMGGICEVYPQILMVDSRDECLSMMRRQIGAARAARSWNRRGMIDAGCVMCCGTDLPLSIPSMGEAIHSACGGHFADGLAGSRKTVCSTAELLRAWTAGGAWDLGRDGETGAIEVGGLADLCAFDRDVLAVDPAEALGVRVALTVSDGRVVYEA